MISFAKYYIYLHFAIPCKTWGAAGRPNCGTRCKDLLEGWNPFPREREANLQADLVAFLVVLQILAGGFFSIENPHESYLFNYKAFADLMKHYPLYKFDLDQCLFGLRPLGAAADEYVRKRITLLTNTANLRSLAGRCAGPAVSHRHVWAWGQLKSRGRPSTEHKRRGSIP